MLPEKETRALKNFIQMCKSTPDILYCPQLSFFKEYLESMGAVIPPPKETNFPKEQVDKEKDHERMDEDLENKTEPEHKEEEQEQESDVELDMTGVIENPDPEEAHEMGDRSKKELTDEEMEAFDTKRSEAMFAYGDGEWEKAIDLFTEAIKINPNSAAMFAKRGTCFLKIQKPNACIRDCDVAIQLNPDNASAYKFRGRAYRLLGRFMESAKDLRLACKIDFDEQADEWLKEVTPNAKLLEEHERKKARRLEEKELKEKKERIRKAQEARAKAAEESASGSSSNSSQKNDFFSGFNDPEISAAVQDILSNPGNFSKYQNNPKIMKFFNEMTSKMSGGIPGMAGMAGGIPGMPGGMPGMPGMAGGMPGGGTRPANENAENKPRPSTDDLD